MTTNNEPESDPLRVYATDRHSHESTKAFYVSSEATSPEEVAYALDALGGEAQLIAIKARLVDDRGGIPPQYSSLRSYFASIQTVVYRHCPDAYSYTGAKPWFRRVAYGRYALAEQLTETEVASDKCRPIDVGGWGRDHAVVHCITSVPGFDGAVSVKLSNIRFIDLLATFGALILAPGTGGAAIAAKLLPTIARMVDLLNDHEVLVVRVLAEATQPQGAVAEVGILQGVNQHLASRGHRQWSRQQLDSILKKLAEKKCIEPMPLPKRAWRLRESVLSLPAA